MYRFILKRLLMMVPVVIGVSLLVFMVLKMSTGDPARLVAGSEADEATVEEIRHELGLDKPILEQYVNYMAGLLRGNFGKSYHTGKDVFTEIMARMPTTFTLALFGMIVSVIIGIPIGILSATKQYSPMDYMATVFALAGVSMPNFWMGLMFILLFSLRLRWLPAMGDGTLKSFIMPALVTGIAAVASLMRTTRSSMLDVIRQDYIRTARAKGSDENRVIMKHALKNALIPVITVIGLHFGTSLGGAVINETVFSLPGLGSFMITGIQQKDEPVVMGSIIMFALVFSLINLIVDILYAFIDPRIKAQYR